MRQTILWMFSVYVFGGIFSILLPLYYRIPIVGGHSITGVAYLATVTAQFSFQEMIGSYIFSGVLMLIIGLLGIFSILLTLVPKEIIAAMLAGMITKYMVNFIVSINEMLLIGGVSLLTYFIFSKWYNRIPPVLTAIVSGFTMLLITISLNNSKISIDFFIPQPQVPDLNPLSLLSVSIPLILMLLSNDAAVGIGALEQKHFHPPVNKIITISGIFSILAGFFGGQSANIAGMASAVCADEEAGPKSKRYMGAIVSGVIVLLFGIFSWKLVPFIQALPQAFISILVGFSLLSVFANNLHICFSKPVMKLSAAFTYVIAMSNITIFNIGSPVWALLIGSFIAKMIENQMVTTTEDKKKETG
jgi:benzoate membrane transport protein